MGIVNMRREYKHGGLRRADLHDDPIEQFALWFEQARESAVRDPNAMSLATASADARPTVRTVLLKYFGQHGFVFFTNYESVKAKQITENPEVALMFLWRDHDRQVIINGKAEKISKAESLKYFLTRPHGAQIGAWVSTQSSVISSRKILEMKFDEIKRKFKAGEVPLPSAWGGYRVKPERMEFWQGRPNRLHDRFVYTLKTDGSWNIERLAP